MAPGDATAWLRLRCALWPEGSESEHSCEITEFLAGRAREPLAVLVAQDDADRLIGCVELSVRPCAEGCQSDRVAYLEGWYVVPDARRHGVGRALIAAAEDWGRTLGCTEFASDAALTNDGSAAAHLALGFTEVAQVRCFPKGPIEVKELLRSHSVSYVQGLQIALEAEGIQAALLDEQAGFALLMAEALVPDSASRPLKYALIGTAIGLLVVGLVLIALGPRRDRSGQS